MDRCKPQIPLDITELLEKVLLHLSKRRVLLLQRVSQFWFNTISGSPKLQQKLFFQPLPPSKAARRPPEFNPLVQEIFPFLFAPHPCLGTHMCGNLADRLIQHWTRKFARRQAILRPEASWRRMLPVQPAAPIEGVMFADWRKLDEFGQNSLEWCHVDSSRHASTLSSRFNLGDNATMGLLYDIILHNFTSSGHSGVYVQWNMFRFTRDILYEYHQPMRWAFSFPSEPMIPRLPQDYRNVEPRNTITIHVIETTQHCGGDCKRSANSTGLRVLLDLPAGVLQRGNKANRYPLANLFPAYETFGRVAPEARSELDIELGQSSEPDEERQLKRCARIWQQFFAQW